MTEKQPNMRDTLSEAIGGVRRRYDKLDRGKTAPLRRCRTADEVALERAFWQIGEDVAQNERHLAHLVLLFPLARHATKANFSFGRYLRNQIGDGDNVSLRFRRVIASRDRDELDHRLRGLLKRFSTRFDGLTGRVERFAGAAAMRSAAIAA